MSIVVPEEVRRLFQVLTGEDMTDADEDALLRVGEALMSGAGAVEGLTDGVAEAVARARGEFSGKAADRFSARVGDFADVLETSGGVLRELGVFVRDVGWQVKYLKYVTVGGLLLLLAEIAWAVAMAGATGGASMAWLAARMAVMRFLLSQWWGQLFMRLAVSAGVGVGVNLLPDVVAQGVLVGEGKQGWSTGWTKNAAGVGAVSAGVGLPLSALGNVVGKTVARVLVAGLGDQVDRAVLEAAARRAAEEHAEFYPISGLAKFADVVAKTVDGYAGMSLSGMWAARFGRGLGESLEEGLTEMVGELTYGVLSGQGVQLNPFSFTAGVSESVASGSGKMAGLFLRGHLVPPGIRDRDQSASGATTSPVDSGSEPKTGDGPDLLGTGEMSDVDSSFSGAGSAVNSDPGFVGLRKGAAWVAGGETEAAESKTGTAESKTGTAEDKAAMPGGESGAAGGKGGSVGAGGPPSAGVPGSSRPGIAPADGKSLARSFDGGRASASAGDGPGIPSAARVGAEIPGRSGESSDSGGQASSGGVPDGSESIGRDVAGVSGPSSATPADHPAPGAALPNSGEPPHGRDVTGDRQVGGEFTAADATVHGAVRGAEDDETSITERPEDFTPAPQPGTVATDMPELPDKGAPGAPPPPYSSATPDVEQARPDSLPPAYSAPAVDVEQARPDSLPPAYSPGGAVGRVLPGTPPPAYSAGDAVGQTSRVTPPLFGEISGDNRGTIDLSGVDDAGAFLDASQASWPGADARVSAAGTPHASGSLPDPAPSTTSHPSETLHVDPGSSPLGGQELSRVQPSDHDPLPGETAGQQPVQPAARMPDSSPDEPSTAAPEASGVAADPVVSMSGPAVSGEVPNGQADSAGQPVVEQEPSRDHAASSGVDVTAGQEDSLRPDDEVAGVLASLGWPSDAVRVQVPAEVDSGGVVAEFLRSRVGESAGGPVVVASEERSGTGVVLPPNQVAEVARSLGRDVVALTPGHGRRGPRWMRFGADGSRPRPVGGPGRIPAPRRAVEGLGVRSAAGVPVSAEAVVPEGAAVESASVGAETVAAWSGVRGEGSPRRVSRGADRVNLGRENGLTLGPGTTRRFGDTGGPPHGDRARGLSEITHYEPGSATDLRGEPGLPVSLRVQGARERAEYAGWTRSPDHAAAVPQGTRPLLVLGYGEMVVSGAALAEVQGVGADVLARVDPGRGPAWLLYGADGSRPRLVDPPAEMASRPRPEPLLFAGPGDSGWLMDRAARLAPVLPDIQVVGVHVTARGSAVLADGRRVGPEDFVAEVRRDRRFVPGLKVALLGCGAYRRPGPGALSFAERFARALRGSAWVADTDVVQTVDGGVHATEVSVASDGRLLPRFVDGVGTGRWSLLGSEGELLGSSGPELRAAAGHAVPSRYPDGARIEAVVRWPGQGERESVDELLSRWGFTTAPEDVRSLATAVELRHTEGVDEPGTRSWKQLWGGLFHVLELAAELGGRSSITDARDVRLVADWIRDAGRMQGPTVTAADVHRLVEELTGSTKDVRLHEVRYLADVLRRVEQGREQRRATLAALRVQWRRGAARAVTVRLGGGTENTVVYSVDEASSRWWQGFHGSRVELDRVRREMGVDDDREPIVVVVQARRRTPGGAEKFFLIGDAVRGTTLQHETPRELGQHVAITEQYRQICAANQDGPVVLVVLGGNAGLGVHLSRDALTRRFAEGLSEGGDGARQVLLADGYISHDPSGFGLVAVESRTGQPRDGGLVLASGRRANVLALRLDSARENTLAYPQHPENAEQFQRLSDSNLRMATVRHAVADDSPTFVLAWITPGGRFVIASGDTWERQELTPREFARRVVEDARTYGIAGHDDNRAIVVYTYFGRRGHAMTEPSRQELAASFRDAGHHGPIHASMPVLRYGSRSNHVNDPIRNQSFRRVIPWSPRLRLTIPVGSSVINAVAYPRNSHEEADWRRWAESGPAAQLDWLLAEVGDDSPILALAWCQNGETFPCIDPRIRQTRHMSAGEFGLEVASSLREVAELDPGKAVVVLAVRSDDGLALVESVRRELARGVRRYGHDGPVYIATAVESDTGGITRFAVQDISLGGGRPRAAELSVQELRFAAPSHLLLAAGGTSADVDWWSQWSSSGFRVSAAQRVGLRSSIIVLARLWGDEFVTPSGTLSAFEFGRQVASSVSYQTSIAAKPDTPVLLATVGAETGLSEHAAREFARGARSNDPDRAVLVSDRDFRLGRDANGVAVLGFDTDPPRFVPPRNWLPATEASRPAEGGPVLVYPSQPGPVQPVTMDANWIISETGHRNPVVVVASPVHGRFHVLDPSNRKTRVLGPSEFGMSVVGNADFRRSVADDPARPVVVVFAKWPAGLTEQDARSLAEGLRSDGIRRPVFLSMGNFDVLPTGWRSYALVEAPSAQSALPAHPAGAVGAQRPWLISLLGSAHADVADQIRSFGVSRLVSELGYRGRQQPIVILTSRVGEYFITPGGNRKVLPERLASILARDLKYLEATRGDWRRPVMIVPVGQPHDADAMTDLTPFTSHLLGTPDADRPVYIADDNVRADRLAMPDGVLIVTSGLRLLTPDRMQPPSPQEELITQTLWVGVDWESPSNGACFPVRPEDEEAWERWGSLNYDGHGPMLRRAVAEFDPDPLFVLVRVQDEGIVVRNAQNETVSPDPVELGAFIQRCLEFELVDAGQLGRTVVLVAISEDAPLADWYARALAEGLRRVGGPPRPVYVYDGYYEEAVDTDEVLDRLRSVTPELHWRRAGDVRDVEAPREFVPRYERESPLSYDGAGEVAAVIAAVDRQRAAAVSGAARPAEVTETEIATIYQRWRADFEEAERALSALPADWLADLQATARTILDSVWQRPRQGDTSSAMAMQNLWERMAHRVAFRLYGDGTSETGAWADAAAMVASIPSLPVVLAVRGSGESFIYPKWTRSPGFAANSPDHGRLVVLGSDRVVVHGESVAEARLSGADVLARTDDGNGPQWMLFRAGESQALPVQPPAEVARSVRPEPMMFFGPGEDAVAVEAVALASDLPDVQVVGVHVTPHGRARWPDGELGPQESAERVWRDRRFVAGLPVVLFGCGAGRRPESGEASFAQRFATSLRAHLWTTDASDVWQTNDGAVHATDTVMTVDGQLLPMFVEGRGTGRWSLLGPDGRELRSHGPELRAALTGSAPPRYAEQADPEPLISWAGGGTRSGSAGSSGKPSGIDWDRVVDSDKASIVETSPRRVYRASAREPDDVLRNGFVAPTSRRNSIDDHTRTAVQDQYVSTTEDPKYHHDNRLFRYAIDPSVTGINVAETLKAQNRAYWTPWEREVLYSHIPGEDIIGYWRYERNPNALRGVSLEGFHRNPYYRGRPDDSPE
ncbi:WXG100-like domain-containing protein [Saccharopolyspora phatthalungensis]|uniref:Outer membrane channel protein CpnT-like N-terminal domain-containing protein n=1 Tax=Saccharopolyspora phatthalungensis TaxID=664693 RepID=A0A840QHF9_9PSEU|nr:hypothetical protein [Saccharopolyspora phatthalungensis]MBB5159601.1 hypothetical protein [Saccharopolyspora phatthalungensis]